MMTFILARYLSKNGGDDADALILFITGLIDYVAMLLALFLILKY